jgi:signal transduction histidine kinase
LEKAKTIEDWKNGLSELRTILAGTMDEVRDLSRTLRPSLLDDQGLVAALDSYINGLKERLPFQIFFTYEEDDHSKRLPGMIELVCYRVAQEALTNVIKHAHPTKVTVTLFQIRGVLLLTVRDDGDGFKADGRKKTDGSGLGLVGMEERAQLVSGNLHIISKPGLGTEVRLEIPLENWSYDTSY